MCHFPAGGGECNFATLPNLIQLDAPTVSSFLTKTPEICYETELWEGESVEQETPLFTSCCFN